MVIVIRLILLSLIILSSYTFTTSSLSYVGLHYFGIAQATVAKHVNFSNYATDLKSKVQRGECRTADFDSLAVNICYDPPAFAVVYFSLFVCLFIAILLFIDIGLLLQSIFACAIGGQNARHLLFCLPTFEKFILLLSDGEINIPPHLKDLQINTLLPYSVTKNE